MNKPFIMLGILTTIIAPFVILLFGKLSYLFVTTIFVDMPSNSAGFISYMMTLITIGGIIYLVTLSKDDKS